MILFIRNNKNRTILDCEVYIKSEDSNRFIELHSLVVVSTYSEFLIENIELKEEIINDFSELSELRGWLWESYFMGKENDPNKYNDVLKILRERIEGVATKYNLYYTED